MQTASLDCPPPPEIKLLPNFILPCGKNPKKRNTPNTMKLNTRNVTKKSGMTLLELTVVILVLLSLISILFIGARAWKRGSDRAGCIMNIRNVQQGIRSYANMYNIVQDGTGSIPAGGLQGSGKFLESAPACPGGGSYTPSDLTLAVTVPAPGSVAMSCSLAAAPDLHAPTATGGW
jgi:type II secretory pathway pseudopilin PulG